MSPRQLILDSALYNKELRRARQALKARRNSKPPPPGRLVGSRTSDWCPRARGPRPGVRPVPTAPFSPSRRAPELREGQLSRASSSVACPPRVSDPAVVPQPAAPAAQQTSQPESEGPQAPSVSQETPSVSPLPESPRPPTFLPAMVSLLELMAPNSTQVPDSNLPHILDLVIHTFFSGD